jgi:SAM-dependent methyltransferase
MSLKNTFTRIWRDNAWNSAETRSGGGSEVARAKVAQVALEDVIARYGIKSVLDAGCGDWNWMRLANLTGVDYAGCDVVEEIITECEQYAKPGVRFFVADLIADPLPKADLILCRCVLFHLSFENAAKVIENFRRSGATYLLATTHPKTETNLDIVDGAWRRLNLEKPPFSFPPPLERFVDGGRDADGALGLWRL